MGAAGFVLKLCISSRKGLTAGGILDRVAVHGDWLSPRETSGQRWQRAKGKGTPWLFLPNQQVALASDVEQAFVADVIANIAQLGLFDDTARIGIVVVINSGAEFLLGPLPFSSPSPTSSSL